MQINSSTLNVNRILSPDGRVFEIANQLGGALNCLLRLVSQYVAHRPETLGFEQYQTPELRRANVVYRQLDETFTQRFNKVGKES
ncbi:hypothetical protein [Nostoc sp.]|uniref:hypothetical protein n=1 Tax=Nostoc sp. TaxID=1180 RepID=UPI002FF4A74E